MSTATPPQVRPGEEAPPAVCSRWIGPGPCGAAATSHIIWSPDGQNSAVCPTHTTEARYHWAYLSSHPYRPACTHGTEHYQPDLDRCVTPAEEATRADT
ncbi:hypothetical protein MXD62_19550 [Frankia sp. Mgl5]|uniref:hypothetical protein n=1 Tax=Frankia sp. Mgl5 TaxID=2933793 RepID=UPI00200EB295|nr:hypothetical protein [Frankia sp. Mgl5]MCK9929348.1 hypothetical protein [Frankia sp. Mgl5]